MPEFPFTEVKSVQSWSNYHGTIAGQNIPVFCTPDVVGEAGFEAPRRMARHGAALKAIIGHCFDQEPGASLRVLGGRWSLSNVIKPGQVVIDPANLDVVLKVRNTWLTESYRTGRLSQGFCPVFVQGGVHIASLNRRLAQTGLALQTSGASDGHRIAGCIATGTHGSALGIGAVHDTVLGCHLITGPNQSVFVQPNAGACLDDLATWLAKETGIPTASVRDDELFHAALVSLGSLGIVHGVIVETVPLYRLRQRQEVRRFDDPDVWRAISELDTKAFHPQVDESPYHFQIALHPYPSANRPGAFITMYWKVSGEGVPLTSPAPVKPDLASDLMGLIGQLSEVIDLPGSTHLLRLVLDEQLEKRYRPGEGHTGFPGEIFGPTGTPPGHGTSTEVVVNQTHARAAIDTFYEILRDEAHAGRHLLGAIGVRFVPATRALLGMNIHPMNVYIEPLSIRTPEVEGIYAKFWDRLAAKAIPFTCHWGQLHGLSPKRLKAYFGDRAERWKTARSRILESARARAVFASPLLHEVGLD